MYISMNNIISVKYYDYDINKWCTMRKEKRIDSLNKIKDFLLSTCRNDSLVSKAINRMSIDNLPDSYGIMDRLTTEGYIAGQDYPGELRFVKNLIKKEC